MTSARRRRLPDRAKLSVLSVGYFGFGTTTAVYPRIAYKAYREGQKVQAETQQRTQLEGKPL